MAPDRVQSRVMNRRRLAVVALAFVFVLAGAVPLPAQQAASTQSPLYRAQGEYAGVLADGAHCGVQLIALTDRAGAQRLRLVMYAGGLPGAGWNRGDPRHEVEAGFAAGAATFASDAGLYAKLGDGVVTLLTADGEARGRLARVARQSPTLGAQPPPDAVVLFDGSSAAAFTDGRLTQDGNLAAGCDGRRGFGDQRLHLEFRTPFQPAARGQGRGNSGVYVQGRYECQILDSFGLEGRPNECGGIYSIAAPVTNACLPPAVWQTYDIVFTAARFAGDRKVADARMTAHHNGILVHDDVALGHATTAHRRPEGAAPGGLYLQDHGNPVEFRNIWVVERDLLRTRNVVFLAGRRSHGYGAHEHGAGCRLLAAALEQSGLNVKAQVIDGWPRDATVLDAADVIVCFADGGNGHPFMRHLGDIDAQVRRAVGLVCLHYAVEVPAGVPGDHFLHWIGGHFDTHWSVNPHWVANFTALPQHPITRGVRPFAINDEWYFHMRLRPGLEAVTPILSALAPASTMQRKDGPHSGNPHVRAAVAAQTPQHVAWARVRPDGGRGFGFTGGHLHWNWAHDDFRKIVMNAIVWCAQLSVPESGVRSATPDLAALQANQDYDAGDRFDPGGTQRLLDSFRRRD